MSKKSLGLADLNFGISQQQQLEGPPWMLSSSSLSSPSEFRVIGVLLLLLQLFDPRPSPSQLPPPLALQHVDLQGMGLLEMGRSLPYSSLPSSLGPFVSQSVDVKSFP